MRTAAWGEGADGRTHLLKTDRLSLRVSFSSSRAFVLFSSFSVYTRHEQAGALLLAMAIPQFAGMSGKKLSWSISTIATLGFLLFGYDRKSPAFPM